MARILIVDDDKYMCALLQNFLLEKGYEVVVTFNGIDGIKKATASAFDIVLCDFVLPDMDGSTVLTRIKGLNPGTVVIIITGYPNNETSVDVIKKGAYDYMLKPIVPDQLLAAMNKALAERIDQKKNADKP